MERKLDWELSEQNIKIVEDSDIHTVRLGPSFLQLSLFIIIAWFYLNEKMYNKTNQ